MRQILQAECSSEPIRVVHVDDDPFIGGLTKIYLERSGQITVYSCLEADQAFDYLTQNPVDVFISDYEMPGLNGIEFLKKLREQNCDLPFILFTGRGREDVVVDAYSNGATSYIQKGGEPKSQYAELLHKVIYTHRQYKSQQKVSHLSRIFRSLRVISHTLHEDEDIDSKLNRVCHQIISETGYRDVRLLLFKPDGGIGQMYHAGSTGTVDSSLSQIQEKALTSCMEKALLTPNGPIICSSGSNCVSCPLLPDHFGFKTLTMRLFYGGKTYGLISVSLDQEYARDPDEQALLVELSREIASAIYQSFQKEEHSAMETLIQANTKLDILNSLTRHDIKNELTITIFHMENLLELSEEIGVIREDISRLHDSLNNIQEHLMFSDVYQKIGMKKAKWLSLSSILENIRLTHNFGSVSIIHSTGTLEVYTDPMFGKIIVNLVENALMHGCRVTTLQVGFIEQVDSGILFIEDDGMGIPDEKKSRIFERGVGKNTGLGLYYTREILGLTGMSITETGTYGTGARFEIRIPRSCYRWYRGEDVGAHTGMVTGKEGRFR
ncbi:MAG: response regulator [Methanospirillaceae archaeon]|nr:response regulator [Methanospirillaceae archaeon]